MEDFTLTPMGIAVIASLIFIVIILFNFFIHISLPPKEKHRRD
ncbi:MAG TPA: hypothetical protein VFV52_04310 [Bacilli bacterium]|nr:hypothetical protein [Bacilli bacterium]